MAFLNFYSKKWSETTRSHQSVTGLQGENNKEENKIENVTRDEEITHAPSPKTFWVDKFNRFANLQDAKEVQRERLIESQHQKHKCHDSRVQPVSSRRTVFPQTGYGKISSQ